MRVLVLSFYYPPDLSAGSFRTVSLVEALKERLPAGSEIHVVTTLPNRYSSFSFEAPEVEAYAGITINRIALRRHQSGVRDQALAYVGFAREVMRVTKGKKYDLVYATSSRLMTAVLGVHIAKRVGAPLYLDIRDIFVDTIKDVFPRSVTWLARPVFSALERWAIRSARKVNLVSRGFHSYFTARYPGMKFSYFTNGIDDEFVDAQPEGQEPTHNDIVTVLYAGNFGEGQGLHAVVPDLARRLVGKARFVLIGDGGRKSQLMQAVDGLDNVEVRPPVKRDELIKIYKDSDILFLHLNDYDAFRKVLPSKIFEYGALGKPMLAGVAGHAADFINEHVTNASVFPPCDAKAGEEAFLSLQMVTAPRKAFVERFSRRQIMADMAGDLLSSLDPV